MRSFLILATFVFLLSALPASACQQCKRYWNYQSDTWCFYCLTDTACGYFQCTITEYWGMDYCGGGPDDDGECFTDYGVTRGWCGPIEIVEIRRARTEASKWLLVKARVDSEKPTRRARS